MCVSVCVSLLFYFMVGDMYCVGETVECVCVCACLCVSVSLCVNCVVMLCICLFGACVFMCGV